VLTVIILRRAFIIVTILDRLTVNSLPIDLTIVAVVVLVTAKVINLLVLMSNVITSV